MKTPEFSKEDVLLLESMVLDDSVGRAANFWRDVLISILGTWALDYPEIPISVDRERVFWRVVFSVPLEDVPRYLTPDDTKERTHLAAIWRLRIGK